MTKSLAIGLTNYEKSGHVLETNCCDISTNEASRRLSLQQVSRMVPLHNQTPLTPIPMVWKVARHSAPYPPRDETPCNLNGICGETVLIFNFSSLRLTISRGKDSESYSCSSEKLSWLTLCFPFVAHEDIMLSSPRLVHVAQHLLVPVRLAMERCSRA